MTTIATPKTQIGQEPVIIYPITSGEVISPDGTPIAFQQVGSGPGLVVMHGGARAGHHYLRLAETLAGNFTVYLPDRRGRGRSGPPGVGYSIEKEMADVNTLLLATGAERVFGHSAGGFFALEAARRLPIRQLALYEPAVSIHSSMPLDWLPGFKRALAKNDPAMAFVHMVKGLQMGPIGWLPGWLLAPMARLMLRSADGQEIAALLPTIIWEADEMLRMEQMGQTYERYAIIQAQTLLIAGSNSPAYLRLAASELSRIIPHARLVEMPRLDHNAPDQNAPEQIAAVLREFFA